MIEWLPSMIAAVGAMGGAYLGIVVGSARLDERQKAMKEDISFLHNEIFGPNKLKDRVHKAEAELIFLKHKIEG